MLKRTILLFLTVITTSVVISQGRAAQNRKQQAISSENESLFGANDPDFEVKEFPEKWKGESAVILCRKTKLDYKKNKTVTDKQWVRTRVKLLDQAAVENFSIFYYSFTKNSKFGLQVTKEDGSSSILDLAESVEVGFNEVPDYYSSGNKSSKYKKIAIPNLERGDIIDYYYGTDFEYRVYADHTSSSIQYFLSSKYPILKQRFDIQYTRGVHFAFRSFNTETKLEEGPAGKDSRGRVRNTIRTFFFEDLERESSKSEYWKYRTLDDPSIKLQFRIPKDDPEDSKLFVQEETLVNEPYSLDFIQKKAVKQTQIMSYSGDKESIIKELKKERENYSSDTEFAKEIYYRLRNNYTRSKIVSVYTGTSLDGYTYRVNDTHFTNTLSYILTKLNIPHKLVIGVDREYETFENVMFPREMTRAIKVEDQYFFQFSNYTIHDYIPKYLLGAKAIEFNYTYPFKVKTMPSYEMVTLPTKTAEQNLQKQEQTVVINEDMSTLNVIIKSTFNGLAKASHTSTAAYQFNYLESNSSSEQQALAQEAAENAPKKKGNKAKIAEEERAKKAKFQEKMDKKLEHLKELREEDYEIESFERFELFSVGRDEETPDLIYEEEFVVNDLMGKAGRNYMLKVGALIGKQLELDKDDMERESNIHINYAKGYQNIINITIPEGYTVGGVSKLNTNVVNEMGEFIVVAKFENNILSLDVKKLYKTQDANIENWPGYVAFLEEAFNFTQKKVILKKASN